MKLLFVVGDIVQPKSEWRNDPLQIPSGKVSAVEHVDLGQYVWIEGDKRPFLGGYFERVAGL